MRRLRNITITIIIVNILLLALAGCASGNKFAPQMIGMSEAQWQKYSLEKRTQIMADYREISLTDQAEDLEVEKIKKASHSDETFETLEVKFAGGTALMSPFEAGNRYAFEPAVAYIIAGTCQNVWLVMPDNSNRVVVRSCYRNKILSLDASFHDPAKRDGTFTILYSPLWERGFTYRNVSSDGHAKLKNVSVTVKQSSVW
jgi:hypothetical protein